MTVLERGHDATWHRSPAVPFQCPHVHELWGCTLLRAGAGVTCTGCQRNGCLLWEFAEGTIQIGSHTISVVVPFGMIVKFF